MIKASKLAGIAIAGFLAHQEPLTIPLVFLAAVYYILLKKVKNEPDD